MGVIGNRYLQGSPILPYPNAKTYVGSDVFLDLNFVDHTLTAIVPTSLTYELDDITNDQNMIPSTVINGGFPAAGSVYTLQLPAAQMVMTQPFQGSQLCQLSYVLVGVDSVTGNPFQATGVYIIELCSIATPSGM